MNKWTWEVLPRLGSPSETLIAFPSVCRFARDTLFRYNERIEKFEKKRTKS